MRSLSMLLRLLCAAVLTVGGFALETMRFFFFFFYSTFFFFFTRSAYCSAAGNKSETGPGGPGARLGPPVYGRRGVSVAHVVTAEPARRLVYEVIGGLPVRDYRGEVTLTPVDGGTRVRWLADWDGTLAGRVVHRLRVFYPEMLAGLAAAAERSRPAAGDQAGQPSRFRILRSTSSRQSACARPG